MRPSASLAGNGNGVAAVFPSGSVWRYEFERGTTTSVEIAPARTGVTFIAASGTTDGLAAVSRTPEGIQAWRLSGTEWTKDGPPLATPGFTQTPRVLLDRVGIIVGWALAGTPRIFRLEDNAWAPIDANLPAKTESWFLDAGPALCTVEPTVTGSLRLQHIPLGAPRAEKRKYTLAMPNGTALRMAAITACRQGNVIFAAIVTDRSIHVTSAALDATAFGPCTEPFAATAGSDTPGIISALILGALIIMLLRQAMLQRTAAALPPRRILQPQDAEAAQEESPLLSLERAQVDRLRETTPGVGYGGLASPIERGMAFLIDIVLCAPFAFGFFFAANSDIGGLAQHMDRMEELLFAPSAASLAFFILYTTIAEAGWGTTLGKWAFGLAVRPVEGGRLPVARAVVRNLLRVIDMMTVPVFGYPIWFFFAMVSVMFSRSNQRVGDRVARTVVTRRIPLSRRKIVLASSSPRRSQLLTALGLSFTVIDPGVEEFVALDATPEEAAVTLAKRKADAVARRVEGAEIIIAADTIVAIDNDRIGKPVDREDAIAILRRLSGTEHRVITGIAIIDRGTGRLATGRDITSVRFAPLTDEQIRAYVDSGESDGKAGAYAIQDEGRRFVQEISGSFTNVIGLPLEMLRDILGELEG